MTKDELEKEAEKYFKSICKDYNEEFERTGERHYWVGSDIKDGYIAGAEPREKRIVELEKENAELKEKLKPENCLKLLAKDGYVKFTSDQTHRSKRNHRCFS